MKNLTKKQAFFKASRNFLSIQLSKTRVITTT